MNTQKAIDNIENDRRAGDITDEQADVAIERLKSYPACDRDDCQYYTLNSLAYIKEKCSECLENCQRKVLDGFNHYESID